MTQAHPVPDVHARGSLAVENMTGFAVSLVGARERTNKIELRAGIDNPADAAQNSIHFAKRSETIDVNRCKTGGLRQQFLVRHFENPQQWKASKDDRTTTGWRQDSVGCQTKIIEHGVAPRGTISKLSQNQTTAVLT